LKIEIYVKVGGTVSSEEQGGSSGTCGMSVFVRKKNKVARIELLYRSCLNKILFIRTFVFGFSTNYYL